MNYPALFDPAPEGGYVVTFRDIPEAITEGDTLDEAKEMAADALLTAMDIYVDERRAVPPPSSPREGELQVALPLSAWLKVLTINAMLDAHVRPAELARRLGVPRQGVTRLLDLHHATKVDELGRALAAMGRRLDIQVALSSQG